MSFDFVDYKKDFPLLMQQDVAYLDSAATAQRPASVLQAEKKFYEQANANPLRGLYELGVEATDRYEAARERVRKFLNARSDAEIIFTRNTTESINLVAYSYALNNIHAGDEIVITIMEHHSNMLPWQMVARKTGAKLVYLECEKDGSRAPRCRRQKGRYHHSGQRDDPGGHLRVLRCRPHWCHPEPGGSPLQRRGHPRLH